MGAELRPDAVVHALAEEVQVVVGQLRREEVRVVLDELGAVPVAHAQPVRDEGTPVRHPALVEAAGVQPSQRPRRGHRLVLPEHRDLDRVRLEHPHEAQRLLVAPRELVIAEHRARLAVRRRDDRLDRRRRERRARAALAGTRHQITGRMFQIRSAYSRTLRSLEKKPMPRQLTTAWRLHSSGRAYSASTRACASA